MDLIKGDVVIIVIAGGNTIPTAAKIIKHAQKRGAKTIGTAGIFGFGDENIEIKDISEFNDDNPAVEELRVQGISEDHLILTTNKLIRDNEPVTPYTLDEVANIITKQALKLLALKYWVLIWFAKIEKEIFKFGHIYFYYFYFSPISKILLLILYKKYNKKFEMIIMGITDYIKTRLLSFPNKFLKEFTLNIKPIYWKNYTKYKHLLKKAKLIP